jgi:hypothetical protein
MSQKGKRNETLKLHANHAPSHEEIRRRAYEIYLERDGHGGNELDDWLQAEAELRGEAFVTRTTREAKLEA